jgi:hypothetical protein
MTGQDSARASFTASRTGSYEFELTVSSGGKTASDRVKVNVIEKQRPDLVVVDAKRVLGRINPRCLGINVNYLMDDESKRINPARTFTSALKELGVRAVRYPGGDKSDSYLWSVPPYDRARPALAVTGDWDWPATDKRLMMPDRKTWRTDPLDFDRFMKVARTAGVESSIVVAVDSGFRKSTEHNGTISMDVLVRTASEWVGYARRNRFPVRCWEIGNESYFEAGARRYAETVIRFAKAMKEADPEVSIGAVALYGESVRGDEPDKGDKTPWNKAVLEIAGEYIDYLIVHDYPNYGWKSYAGYLTRDPDFTHGIRETRKAIDRWASPKSRDRIRIALTEYGAIDYAKPEWSNVTDLGHALVLVNMIGQYLAEPALDYALMWNTRWVSNYVKPIEVHDALAPDNSLTPTGMALAIWAKFLGTMMLRVEGGRQLKVFAVHTPETGVLNVLVINKGLSPHDLVLLVENCAKTTGDRWVYSGMGSEDSSPALVRAGPVTLADGRISVNLPPVSLTVLSFIR